MLVFFPVEPPAAAGELLQSGGHRQDRNASDD
jgi:hypothetical protein